MNTPDMSPPSGSQPNGGISPFVWVIIAVVVVLGIGGAVFAATQAGDDDNKVVAAGDTATSTPDTGALPPDSAAALPSVAGQPCVAFSDTLPEGSPPVDVKVGPAPQELVTEDLTVGTGVEATPDMTVSLHYTGVACSTGKIFESSWSTGEPISGPLGQFVPGFSQGVTGMKTGGVRLIGIPSELAYGPTGNAAIAPDEAIWFVVSLLEETAATLPEGCVDTAPAASVERPTFTNAPTSNIDASKQYTATISTSCGEIVVALDAKNAPVSVNNFVTLARAGFFDGLSWHRVAKGFIIQSGDPEGTGSGGPGYKVQSEAPPGGSYAAGDLAWAKTGEEKAGTAGSQFFVVSGDASALPAEYGFIGKITAGIENAQKIESLAPASGDGPPAIPMYINTVTITEQ